MTSKYMREVKRQYRNKHKSEKERESGKRNGGAKITKQIEKTRWKHTQVELNRQASTQVELMSFDRRDWHNKLRRQPSLASWECGIGGIGRTHNLGTTVVVAFQESIPSGGLVREVAVLITTDALHKALGTFPMRSTMLV